MVSHKIYINEQNTSKTLCIYIFMVLEKNNSRREGCKNLDMLILYSKTKIVTHLNCVMQESIMCKKIKQEG